MLKNLGLEERIEILEDFIDKSPDINTVDKLFREIFEELEYRKKEDDIVNFEGTMDSLETFRKKEEQLLDQYTNLMFQEKFPRPEEYFMNELERQLRIIKGLSEDAKVTIVYGEEDTNHAAEIVKKKMGRFDGTRKEGVNYQNALNLLFDIVKLRVEVYRQLYYSKDKIGILWNLSKQDYKLSWQKGSGAFQQRLEDQISELVDYINNFAQKVVELVQKYPSPKLLEVKKLLPAGT